jgi:hypothetical protein
LSLLKNKNKVNIDNAKLPQIGILLLSPNIDKTAPFNSIIKMFNTGIKAEISKTPVTMRENLILLVVI